LSRIAGTHPDYNKLIRLGIDGLADEIRGYMAHNGSRETNLVYSHMLETLTTFTTLCEYYEKQAEEKGLSDMALTFAIYPEIRLRTFGKPFNWYTCTQFFAAVLIMAGWMYIWEISCRTTTP